MYCMVMDAHELKLIMATKELKVYSLTDSQESKLDSKLDLQ